MQLPRIINPATNPAGLLAAAGAVYAAAVMIYNVVNHHGVIDTAVIVAAIGAVGALFSRQLVTPTADPRSADGTPLVPAGSAAAVTANPMGGTGGTTGLAGTIG